MEGCPLVVELEIVRWNMNELVCGTPKRYSHSFRTLDTCTTPGVVTQNRTNTNHESWTIRKSFTTYLLYQYTSLLSIGVQLSFPGRKESLRGKRNTYQEDRLIHWVWKEGRDVC